MSTYDLTIGDHTETHLSKRAAMYRVVRYLFNHGIRPETIQALIPWRAKTLFLEFEGKLSSTQVLSLASRTRNLNGNPLDAGRYYCDDAELFYSNDRTYALTRMWEKKWKYAMQNLCDAFPDMRISYRTSDSK
jgi:hypothetical protein